LLVRVRCPVAARALTEREADAPGGAPRRVHADQELVAVHDDVAVRREKEPGVRLPGGRCVAVLERDEEPRADRLVADALGTFLRRLDRDRRRGIAAPPERPARAGF